MYKNGSVLSFAVYDCTRGWTDEGMVLVDVATPAQLPIGP